MTKFTNSFFTKNRKKLIKNLPEHFLVFTAHSMVQSAADIAYPFRQDSSFWYFTGIEEPDIWLTIDTETNTSVLYLPQKNEYQNEWDGEFDHTELQKTSGIDEIRFKSDLKRILKTAINDNRHIGYLPPLPDRVEPYGFYANPARKLLLEYLTTEGECPEDALVDIRKHVARLRQVKQAVEIQAIQKAIDITGAGLKYVQENIETYAREGEAQRALSAEFLRLGSDKHAFEPIVASGANAAIIHYEKSHSQLRKLDLVLFDVGADYGGYAADVSRVYSIGKAPSARQKEIWQACLDIQQYAFSLLKPGVLLRDYQKKVEEKANSIFLKLNCSMADKPFPHGISHFLGLDPHDAGLYEEPLVEGCVITVEPGIYLPDEGIGVRVEDDVLITKTGIRILSDSIPKLLY
jgi:Xaa-Pro aminopeptidase